MKSRNELECIVGKNAFSEADLAADKEASRFAKFDHPSIRIGFMAGYAFRVNQESKQEKQ